MGNSILFNTAGSIALAINYELQGPYTAKFLTKEAAKTIRVNKEVFIRVDDAVVCIQGVLQPNSAIFGFFAVRILIRPAVL